MANRDGKGDAAHSPRQSHPSQAHAASGSFSSDPPAAPQPMIPSPRLRAYKTLPHDEAQRPHRDLVQRFAQILRAARLRRGLSQDALSSRLDFPRTRISIVESGTQDIRISTVFTLAAALRINPGELMPIMFLPDQPAAPAAASPSRPPLSKHPRPTPPPHL